MYGCRVNREDFPDEERMNEKDSSVERQRKLNGRGWGRWKALKRPSLAMKRGDDASCFLLSVSPCTLFHSVTRVGCGDFLILN